MYIWYDTISKLDLCFVSLRVEAQKTFWTHFVSTAPCVCELRTHMFATYANRCHIHLSLSLPFSHFILLSYLAVNCFWNAPRYVPLIIICRNKIIVMGQLSFSPSYVRVCQNLSERSLHSVTHTHLPSQNIRCWLSNWWSSI